MTLVEGVRHAPTIEALLQCVDQFVSTLGRDEMALLPPALARCRPATPDHIREAAIQLASARVFGAQGVPAARMEAIFAFFTAAATSLGQLEHALRRVAWRAGAQATRR